MRKIIVPLIVCFTSIPAIAQEKKIISYTQFCNEYTALLKKQPASNYRVGLTTKLYSDVNSGAIAMESKGTIEQGSEGIQLVRSGSKVLVQDKNQRLEIDTLERSIMVIHPMKTAVGVDFSEQLKNCDSTKYVFYKQVVKGNSRFIVKELEPQSSNEEVIMEFNGKSGSIQSLSVLYWKSNYSMNDLNDVSQEQPKLELVYTEFQSVSGVNERVQQEMKKWVSEDKKNKQLIPASTTYRLNDLRVNEPNK